jgi:hypothetical protein
MGVGSQRHAPAVLLPEKDPTIVQVLGGPAGSFWTGAENLARTGIRSLDRPARSELLCRLNYSGPLFIDGLIIIIIIK